MATGGSFTEGDLTSAAGLDSPGRLLVLCDGVFAIAMTLLALDLKVPDLGRTTTDHALNHALWQQVPSYLSFLISFYVVASYWTRHRRLMRAVESADGSLVKLTLFLLFCVAALPFPAALVGRYASHPISLAVYGGLNALASLTLLRMHRTVRTHHLVDSGEHYLAVSGSEVPQLVATFIVFLILIPSGYVVSGANAWPLLLLLVVNRPFSKRLIRQGRRRRRHEA